MSAVFYLKATPSA